MKDIVCSLLPAGAGYGVPVVRSLRYDGDDLVFDVQGADFAFIRVIFSDPIGFRMLDERDLTEFWPQCSTTAGWLWQVEAGGWLALEQQRATFCSAAIYCGQLKEFLVVDDKCYNVISRDVPRIVEVGPRQD